ncbi:hypothetical protein HanPI659440_Chr16g0660601 [Helianthus annuus]|nr:hypothetical protein HanPI659440_Chr16g0660601 [Helianthus annuus]
MKMSSLIACCSRLIIIFSALYMSRSLSVSSEIALITPNSVRGLTYFFSIHSHDLK